MSKLLNLKDRLKKYDPNRVLNEVLSKAEPENVVRNEITDRLNKKGEDSEGRKLKTYNHARGEVYSAYTIQLKKAMRQEWRRVTLKDTGEFHKTLELKLQNDFFNVIGISDKEDGKIEDNVDLTNVMNLSTEEKTKLVNEIRGKFIQETRKTIGL